MKLNLHIGRKRTVLFEKYSIEHEKKLFLLNMLDGCELKLHEDFPNSVFYVKDNIVLFEKDKTNKYLWVDYYKILLIFKSKYSMNYEQIQMFIKHTLENPLKWKEFTHVDKDYMRFGRLENSLKWREFK